MMGISAKASTYPESYVARMDLFAGPFPNIDPASPVTTPSFGNLEGAALHTQCVLNGTKSSIYYAYSKDLKNVGAQFAFPTSDDLSGPTNNNKAAIVCLAKRTNQIKQSSLTGLTPDAGGGFTTTADAENTW